MAREPFHEGSRALQDRFDTRRLADHAIELLGFRDERVRLVEGAADDGWVDDDRQLGNRHPALYVGDVDAHHERAAAEGATIHLPPEDTPYGDRRYDTEDLEGHRWSFAQVLREVEPEEWGATATG